jgi:hypothetical protein
LSRFYAVEDETEYGLGDFVVHLDSAALDKIAEITDVDNVVIDIIYMDKRDKKMVYGQRSNFFADEVDLISFLLDLKFIGPDAMSHEDEGKVFCVEQIMLYF